MRLALAAVALVVAVGSGWAQDAGARYEVAYFLTGFRLRAAKVCPGDAKAMVRRAFAPVSSPELQAFSKAFPQTIAKWMSEGANTFNTGVLQDGIGAACQQARK